MKRILSKENFKKLYLEFIAAFLGVLIALSLNGWVDSYKETKFIKSAYNSIYKSNLQNISAADTSIVMINNLVDTVSKYMHNDEKSLSDLIKMNDGIHIRSLKKMSIHLFRDSKFITKINFELISAFSDLEESYSSLKENNHVRLISVINNSLFSKRYEEKYLLYMTLRDLSGAMAGLVKNCKRVNILLEKEGIKPE
ncbi:MAG: hypothetical protein N4A49_13845 [Marinifilaceae bacterium]|jgi:hypothetical protein|nr:hypothetical protein [Marinifilaceae bacterium]